MFISNLGNNVNRTIELLKNWTKETKVCFFQTLATTSRISKTKVFFYVIVYFKILFNIDI